MDPVNFFGEAVALSRRASNSYHADSLKDGVVTGADGGDYFDLGPGTYTIVGGKGDNMFVGVTNKDKIIQRDGSINTVVVDSDYVMPDGIQNMTVNWARAGVMGNDLGNYIVDKLAHQSIDGGRGDDVMTGGGGGDSYVFDANSGHDVITDFRAGSGSGFDTVRLAGYDHFKTFADVQAALTQVGNDTVLKLDDHDAVKFLNVKAGDLTGGNFLTMLDTSKMTLTFDEEFNAPIDAASGDHSAKWRTDYGFGGDPNGIAARTFKAAGETDIDVDPTMKGDGTSAVGVEPLHVGNGVLDIHAAPTAANLVDQLYGYKVTSGEINTRSSFTQTYGYFEARMKLPEGQGVWPAFWLYTTGTDRSELDVMEQRGSARAGTWTGTTHDYSSGSDNANYGVFFTPDMTSQFHTYGVLWTAETVTWYLDGVAVRSIPTPPDMHGPMYMIAGLSTDGTVPSNFKGADLQIDYIRAYSLADAPAAVTHQAGAAAEGAASGGTVTGGVGHDYLNDAAGASTLVGHGDDNVFFVNKATTMVVQDKGYGNAIVSSVDYTLPANVQKLTLVGDAHVGIGNDMNSAITADDGTDTLIGRSGGDTLVSGKGVDTLIGHGGGDDMFYVNNPADKVVEKAGGWNAIISSVDYSAPIDIQQLTLTGTATHARAGDQGMTLVGNDLDDTLIGGKGNDRIVAGHGNDVLTGGGGANDFVFQAGFGHDVITDFDAKSDRIDWSALKAAGLSPAVKDSGADAVVSFGAETITLLGVHAADLMSHHIFG